MRCTGCGERLGHGQIVCPRCGATQSRKPDSVRCVACGGRVATHLLICPRCGHDVTTTRARIWQKPAVQMTALATLVVTALLVILIGRTLRAGAEGQSPVSWFIAARPTSTPTATPAPTATATPTATHTPTATLSPPPTATPSPTPLVRTPPTTGIIMINPLPHVSQYLNNCGPASASMVLAHFGISQSQKEIARSLRPSSEDINVRLEELADYLSGQGLNTRYGVEGSPALLALCVSNGVPVVIESWIEYHGGMGHFRVVRGFDADARQLIMHDPLGGADLRFSYDALDAGWRVFNRHYLAVYRPEQKPVVAAILGEDYDQQKMRTRALQAALARTEAQPGDGYAWLNLGEDYAALGWYAQAGEAYEQAMALSLPDRLLWYYHKPLEVYNALGEYQRTVELTTDIIRQTDGLEEMYYLRGAAYQGLEEIDRARADYQAALARNPNYAAARTALDALGE